MDERRSSDASWEDLRREARKLEGDLDVKLSSYAKLCSLLSGHMSYRDSGTPTGAGELLGSKEASWRSMEMEIESLLGRLGEVNDRMSELWNSNSKGSSASSGPDSSAAGGAGTVSMSQKLARHRDILQGLHQEFRRTKGTMTSLREHAELLSSVTSHLEDGRSRASSMSPSVAGHLTERKAIQGNIAQIDVVISQATATKEALAQQRSLFAGWQGRLKSLSERFPAVRNLLAAIRRKRSRDTIILGAVIVCCTSFLIIYWLMK